MIYSYALGNDRIMIWSSRQKRVYTLWQLNHRSTKPTRLLSAVSATCSQLRAETALQQFRGNLFYICAYSKEITSRFLQRLSSEQRAAIPRISVEDTAFKDPLFVQFLAGCDGLEQIAVTMSRETLDRTAEEQAALEKLVRDVVGDQVRVRVMV